MAQRLTHMPEPAAFPAAPIRYPANGAGGVCPCDRAVTYICGTNGPAPGTWWHTDDDTPCPATPTAH
ncbi:hypothetical protein AB0E08_07510 [Streptomyces sp. NPDC048281]|uniref:hypothetical protein n=1 Tax=Streptomyces sp. NPDC048281 TaxID=3154715 RepID=UPI00341B2F63